MKKKIIFGLHSLKIKIIFCSSIGGRQIEVKFISTTLPTDVFGGDASSKDEDDLSNDEAKQFQSMIYNLMVSSDNL